MNKKEMFLDLLEQGKALVEKESKAKSIQIHISGDIYSSPILDYEIKGSLLPKQNTDLEGKNETEETMGI